LTFEPKHIFPTRRPEKSLSDAPSFQRNEVRQTVKLTLRSSGRNPAEPICERSDPSKGPNRPQISSVTSNVKERRDQKPTEAPLPSRRARLPDLSMFVPPRCRSTSPRPV